MKAIVSDWSTQIFPTEREIKELCKIGAGADCCVWLVCGSEFECTCLSKPHSLLDRWEKGLTVAKRNGCDKVNNFNPSGIDGEVEF